MPKLKYDLVVFDCDGTLTDSARQIALFCNDLNISGNYSLPSVDVTNAQEVRKVMGVNMKTVFTKYGFPQEEIPCLEGICRRNFSQNPRYISPPFPGIINLLEKLKEEKVTTGLITANLLVNIKRDLGSSISYFAEVFDRQILAEKGWEKANALIWMKEHFKSKAPVYIGDTLGDKKSAEKANWPFIWAEYGWETPTDNFPLKASSVDNLAHLLGI